MRVARLALVVPAALDELRSGRIHLTGLFVLSRYVTPENADELLGEARGKSRSELECLLARLFPRPDVAERIAPIAGLGAGGVVVTGLGAGADEFRGRTEPLSAARYRVEFTASSEFCEKLGRARELLSHSLPNGDLGTLLSGAIGVRSRAGGARAFSARSGERGGGRQDVARLTKLLAYEQGFRARELPGFVIGR